MTAPVEAYVIGGADTHRDTVHVAVIDQTGRALADREVPASTAGYRQAVAWWRAHGVLRVVGVEGTGCYGAGLARHLRAARVAVVEVDRPDRRARRRQGKSDPIDAYAAATAVLSGRACALPKAQDGAAEAVRALRVARRGAVKARTQAVNALKGLLVTAPAPLREQLQQLGTAALINVCAGLRPGADLTDPAAGTKTALRRLARRVHALTVEIRAADLDLGAVLGQVAAPLLELTGVGTDVAATMLTTAGDNPDRMRAEPAFARHCASAPIPASSGRTVRHRLHRGGDRDANRALYMVAITRMRHCPRTRAYVARRTAEGRSRADIIRCLKRYIAREIYHVLKELPALQPPPRRSADIVTTPLSPTRAWCAARPVGRPRPAPALAAKGTQRLRGQRRPQAVAQRSRQRPLRPEGRPRNLRGAPWDNSGGEAASVDLEGDPTQHGHPPRTPDQTAAAGVSPSAVSTPNPPGAMAPRQQDDAPP